jgi:pimeloyl-ACP methyl ester carboxylesterase
MPTLEVPGAKLHYETFGTGPLLLLIHGGNGHEAIFHPIAKILQAHYTTVCYERRGWSQSILVGKQDFANRLSTDADDAQKLIAHLSSGPAAVFGSSSGAIVGQELLIRHPESVKIMIAHEPPSFSVLPQEYQDQGKGLIKHVYETYRAHGTEEAIRVFTSGLSKGGDAATMRQGWDPLRGNEVRANLMFWFEFEIQQYPGSELDLDKLKAQKDKYVAAVGEDSIGGPISGPISVIANTFGKELSKFPGGHVGYLTDPELFCEKLVEILGETM